MADKQQLTIHGSSTTPTLKPCVCLCVFRETNMKVRQSVSVTSDLGDQSNLESFDGEFCTNFSLLSVFRCLLMI